LIFGLCEWTGKKMSNAVCALQEAKESRKQRIEDAAEQDKAQAGYVQSMLVCKSRASDVRLPHELDCQLFEDDIFVENS
jgi:hypothetical protein